MVTLGNTQQLDYIYNILPTAPKGILCTQKAHAVQSSINYFNKIMKGIYH